MFECVINEERAKANKERNEAPQKSSESAVLAGSTTRCPKCKTKLNLMTVWYKQGCPPTGIKGYCANCDCEYVAAPDTTFVVRKA